MISPQFKPQSSQDFARLHWWLPTTPLVEHSALVSQSLAWFVLGQETDYHATLILLALEAWRAEHGQLPEKLDELVGSELDALPLDPLCARPFLYYPHGFADLPTNGWSQSPSAGVFYKPPTNQPFLWSALSKTGDPQQIGVRPDDFPGGDEEFPYCFIAPSGQRMRGPEADVLRYGTGYLIPQTEKQP
jgi:hypothetical protein